MSRKSMKHKKFTGTMDRNLIGLVREYPTLYDPTQSRYLDMDAREVLWNKIGEYLNVPAAACKTRWRDIRDMMRRRIRERIRGNTNKPIYRYEHELQFMFPFFKDLQRLEGPPEEEQDVIPSEFLEDNGFESVDVDLKPILSRDAPELNLNENFQEICQLNPSDQLDVFLMTIGATLRKFNPYYMNKAKSKIFQVVQDFELQQIVKESDQAGSSDGDR